MIKLTALTIAATVSMPWMSEEAKLITQFAQNELLNKMLVVEEKELTWEAQNFDQLDRLDREYGRLA